MHTADDAQFTQCIGIAGGAAASYASTRSGENPWISITAHACANCRRRLLQFFDEHIYPNEKTYEAEVAENRRQGDAFVATRIIEELKAKARAAGLWNLFLPHSPRAPEGLSNLEYAPLCEIMGRVPWAPEVFNCSAPDTGNMETIERYGTEAHKDTWLRAAARRRDSLGVPDDRAGGGLLGCHQHRMQHPPRRR